MHEDSASSNECLLENAIRTPSLILGGSVWELGGYSPTHFLK